MSEPDAHQHVMAAVAGQLLGSAAALLVNVCREAGESDAAIRENFMATAASILDEAIKSDV